MNTEININSPEFKIAFALTIQEFSEILQKNGASIEETKSAILENMDAIAKRTIEIMPK